MFISNINKYHNGDMVTAKKLIQSSKELGCDYVKINKYNKKKINKYNNFIETPLGIKSLDKYYDRINFTEDSIKELSEYSKSLDIIFFAKVEDIESIHLMCKYTDICELDYKMINYKIFRLAKKKFKKVILRIIEPDINELENIFYSYNPDIIIIDTCNLNIIKKINNKIGKIDLGFRNSKDVYYIPALIYGCTYFEKELNLMLNNISYEKFNNLIKNIKLIKEKIKY